MPAGGILLSHCSAVRKPGVTAKLTSFHTHFLVRCQLDPAVFLRVFSTIARHSVLLVGLSPERGPEVVALISLPEPVDPAQTSAALNGDHFELTIVKALPPGATS
jgi:hypothetical protein